MDQLKKVTAFTISKSLQNMRGWSYFGMMIGPDLVKGGLSYLTYVAAVHGQR